MNVGGVDLTGARLQGVLNAAGDTLALGLVMPPDLAAAMGGGIGFRLDLPLDSLPFPVPSDSMLAAIEGQDDSTDLRDTGRRETVAGVACEVWEMWEVAQPDERIEMCLAEPPAAFEHISNRLKERFPPLDKSFDELKEAMGDRFGGRNLFPVRMRIMGTEPFTFELRNLTESADPSFFVLPVDLTPFPLEMFKGMLPADSTQG
jgi:hypothetical protein